MQIEHCFAALADNMNVRRPMIVRINRDANWQDLLAKQMYPCEQQGPKCVPLALYLKLLKSSYHPGGLSEHD